MEKEIIKLTKLTHNEFEDYIYATDLNNLHNIKLYLDDLYYNTGDSTGIEDYKYDSIKEILQKREPGYIPAIGAKIRKNENRIELPFWLGSMNKFKPEDSVELKRWLGKNKAKEYIIEDKLDGISCLLISQKSKLKLYTRGDGVIGADISYLAQYFKNIPKDLKEDIAIRGELIMNEKVFIEKYSGEFANPRNMVAGRIGSKTIRKGLEDIEFISYEIVNSGILVKPEDQLNKLSDLGFVVVNHTILDSITIEALIEIFMIKKLESKFEIDGIIIQSNVPYKRNTSGNPSYAFAFKVRLDSNLMNAEVEEVEWNISKWGLIKPRIRIKPIQLGGVTITYTSGFNAKYIEINNIGPGTIIRMTRSGDVIPFIVEVIHGTQAQFPDIPYLYKWNETHVDIVTEENKNIMCVKLIASFFASLKIKHISEATVDKMYNYGLDNILKIISTNQEEFEKIEGFGKRLAERTYQNLHNGLQNISLSTLLGASGVFGMGMGKRKVENLLNAIPDLLTLYKIMTKEDITIMINSVEGFSDKTTSKIVHNLPWADKFVESIKPFISLKDETKDANDLKNMKVVFTGFRDLELEEMIKKRGGNVTTSVSKNTTILVVADKNSSSSKIQKARDLGIDIYDNEEFVNIFF